MIVEVEKKWKKKEGAGKEKGTGRQTRRKRGREHSAICSPLCSVLQGGGEKRL